MHPIVPGHMNLDKLADAILEDRRKNHVSPEPKVKTGYLARYAAMVSSANKGAVLETK